MSFAVFLLAVLFICTSPAPSFAILVPASTGKFDMYIVQLRDPSVAMHFSREEMQDMAAAEAAAAASATRYKTLAAEPAAQSHAAFLTAQANAAVGRTLGAGSLSKIKSYYRYAYAGFAIGPLTPREAAALKSDVNVANVVPDGVKQLQTLTTPTFLGLNVPGGIWSQLGGVSNAGEGIVIGVLDSGIWPENPAFYDAAGVNGTGQSLYSSVPPHFKGVCSTGDKWPTNTCNKKLVGCRYFTTGFGGDEALKTNYPDDFASCRDGHAHGSHTSSTAAGNYGTTAPDILPGTMSGMAPHARVAMYKVCFGGGGCPDTGSVAAIEQAVLDGVDVINFSIGGGPPEKFATDPVELAFRGAAAAGVFIAASAGNSGPGASTVDHNSPWLTTVAASTHSRSVEATVSLGDDSTYSGSSKNKEAFGPALVVLAEAIAKEGAEAEKVRLCMEDTLDAAKAEGKIVVCDRGQNARIEKSANVKAAGGVGMILLNTAPDTTAADSHTIPTIHLDSNVRDAVREYAQVAGAFATLSAAMISNNAVAPQMASFSSRGPAITGGGVLIKPDITAPGVDILAAVAPPNYEGAMYATMQGTSMSSPHIAGVAALIRQAHPDWSPMAVKSAIMTTAYQTTRTGKNPGQPFGNPFDYGAGHVDPTAALNPGLVIDAGIKDWMQFLCGQGEIERDQWSEQCPACITDAQSCSPGNLNYPSIALPVMVGAKTVKRVLKSVLNETAEFTPSIETLEGFEVTTSPASFTLAPGQSIRVNITVSWAGAAFDEYKAGAVTWASTKGTKTRVPIVAKAQQFGAPKSLQVASTGGAAGEYSVTPGFSGGFVTLPVGLEASAVSSGTLKADSVSIFDASETARSNIVTVPIEISEDTVLARFALFDSDMAEPGNDIDLYLYNASGRVASSGESSCQEDISLSNPLPGTYTVYVHAYHLPNSTANYKLHTWQLKPATSAPQGSLKTIPAVGSPVQVTVGEPTTVKYQVESEQMETGNKYLGAIVYGKESEAGVQPFNAYTLITVA
eukprot:gene11057-11212_t